MYLNNVWNCFRFCAERFASLTRTLELADISDFSSLVLITNFATLVGTYARGIIMLLPSLLIYWYWFNIGNVLICILIPF